MSRPRALPPLVETALFLGLGLVAVQAALIPLGPGGALVAPDLLYGLVIAWVIRAPGERAALGGGGARPLRRRDAVAAAGARGARAGAGVRVVPAAAAALRGVPFLVEWLAASAVFAVMLAGMELALALVFADAPRTRPRCCATASPRRWPIRSSCSG